MKKAKTGLHKALRTAASLLMSVLMLAGNLPANLASAETQYFNADGWVIVSPAATPEPSVTPEPLPAP